MLSFIHDLTENKRHPFCDGTLFPSFQKQNDALNVQHASHVSLDTVRNERKTRSRLPDSVHPVFSAFCK